MRWPGRPPLEAPLLSVRPHRISLWAGIAATIVVAAMIVVGILLHGTNEGVQFTDTDQGGLIGVGVVMGGLIMTAARPRLRVDASGLWVRNVLGESFFAWPLIQRVAFPPGAPWAQLILPSEETHPLMAIQAMDKQRAVVALRELRSLLQTYGSPLPVRADRPVLDDPDRPLGRLELIDRDRAPKTPGTER